MPCLLAILAVAFPRVAIILLWLFTTFFNGVYHGIVIPILGFIFLPLTLIVYTYIAKFYPGPLTIAELVAIFVAVIIDLGLWGGGAWGRGRRV
jgi:hypothetical protein